MRFLYNLVKFLPFWAIPAGLFAAEVALIFRRRGRKDVVWKAWLVSGFFFFLTALFFFYRWDVHSVPFLHRYMDNMAPHIIDAAPSP